MAPCSQCHTFFYFSVQLIFLSKYVRAMTGGLVDSSIYNIIIYLILLTSIPVKTLNWWTNYHRNKNNIFISILFLLIHKWSHFVQCIKNTAYRWRCSSCYHFLNKREILFMSLIDKLQQELKCNTINCFELKITTF